VQGFQDCHVHFEALHLLSCAPSGADVTDVLLTSRASNFSFLSFSILRSLAVDNASARLQM